MTQPRIHAVRRVSSAAEAVGTPTVVKGPGEPGVPEDDVVSRRLMLAAQRGDRQAFEDLIRRLSPSLGRGAHHMVHPSYVEDLLQETWYRAWRSRHTYHGDAQPLTWLYTIMTTAATSRTLRPTASAEGATDDLACVSSAADVEAFEVADAIDRALARIEDRQAQVVRLRHLEDKDWTTIAAQVGLASAYEAKKTYREVMAKLAAIHAPSPARAGSLRQNAGPRRRW